MPRELNYDAIAKIMPAQVRKVVALKGTAMRLARQQQADAGSEDTHKSNTTSNDQAEGRDTVGRGGTGSIWDGATSGSSWGGTAGGGNGWGGNTGGSGRASVDGDDTVRLISMLIYEFLLTLATHSWAEATAAMAATVRARTLNCILTVEGFVFKKRGGLVWSVD